MMDKPDMEYLVHLRLCAYEKLMDRNIAQGKLEFVWVVFHEYMGALDTAAALGLISLEFAAETEARACQQYIAAQVASCKEVFRDD